MLVSIDSVDYYTSITKRYAASSTAVVTALAGRNNTAGILTNNTSFVEELTFEGEAVEATTLFRGHAFYLESLPVATATILQFMDAADVPLVCIAVDSNGIISAYRGNQTGTLLASAATPIAVGISYYLEHGVTIDAATGSVEVRLWLPDGVTRTTIIDFTGNTGAGTMSKIGHGTDIAGLAVPVHARWDDLYCCDNTGSAFNTFLGNRSVKALLPENAGFYTTWGPEPAPPNYANVDENPPSETDYNFAPIVDPSSSPTFVGEAHSLNSYDCDIPAGSVGDILIAVLRTSVVANGDSLPQIDRDEFWSSGTIGPTGQPDGVGAGVNMTFPFEFGAPVLKTWEGQVFSRRVDGTEPATYTFQYQTTVDSPTRIPPLEITILRYTGVNQAISVEDNTFNTSAARGTTVSFVSVDAFTDNDLIVAVEITEDQQPATPAGYTANYSGTRINVSSKLKSPPGGETPPSTALAAADSWGTNAFSLKANAQLATGDKDTFLIAEPPNNDSFVVNLLAKQADGTDHSVGAATRQGSTDTDSAVGVEPDSTFKLYQFPFEQAFNTGGEAGYALDTPPPTPPPDAFVVFWVDADDLAGTFADGDPITSIVETGIHGYTLSPARSVAGNHVLQTFQTSVAAINNKDSIEGFTESLACTPATRNIGYFNGATNSDLFLGDAFTLVCVFNLSQFDGCWQSGDPHIIFRRGTDAGGDLAGWALRITRTSGGDPGATGGVLFERYDSALTPIVTLFSGSDTIVEGQTYLVTVICDGVAGTVRMRLDGVEVDTAANVAEIEPAANDLWFLTSGLSGGNSQNPPQGQTPYIKIWAPLELDGATLTAVETALITEYGI